MKRFLISFLCGFRPHPLYGIGPYRSCLKGKNLKLNSFQNQSVCGQFGLKSCFLGVLSLSLLGFSCGLANYNFSSGNNTSSQDSQVKGTFVSSAGRLTSKSTCSDNEDCVELCDSMLNRLSLQRDCYEKTEEEVQALRDTFNLLALGYPNKLARIEPEEMEKFLEFSPKLYQSAIYGFERGRKEDCTPKLRPEDPREREDCKLKNYYQQWGYHSGSASHALEWIARNNWLAELLIEHDEAYIIMLSLLDILAKGGEHPEESNSDKKQICHIEDDAGNAVAGIPKAGICPFYNPDATYHGRLNLITSGVNGYSATNYSSCDWNKDGSMDSSARSWSSAPDPADSFTDHLKAFGADCLDVDKGRKNYFLIAVSAEQSHSANLGHQVLTEKLCKNSDCEQYFYCTIQDKEPDPAGTAPQSLIIQYMTDRKNGIKKFESKLHACPP